MTIWVRFPLVLINRLLRFNRSHKSLEKGINAKFLYFFVPVILLVISPLNVFCQAPVANFSADVVSGCKPIIVKFSDQSSNIPTSWSWDLGNGTISTAKDPVTTYLEAGLYTIKLIATNADGSTTVIKTNYITVYDLPVIDFFSNDTIGCAPLRAGFKDRSGGSGGVLQKWEWAFGDGGISNAQNPNHNYTTAGTYNVSLKVTNSNGCSNTGFKSQYITAGGPLQSDFNFSISPYCGTPVKVFFSNLSSAADSLSHIWNFGDGSTSTEGFPTHDFNSFGDFTLKLINISTSGCRDTVKKVISLVPKFVDFSGPDTVCVNAQASYTVASNPAPLFVSWRMDDGTTYNTSTINHTYSEPGEYTITLLNDFGGCVSSVSKKIIVSAGPPPSFTSSDTIGCKTPFSTSFVNLSPGAVSQIWDFGDSDTSTLANPTHIYSTNGDFDVTLTLTDAAGCTSRSTNYNFVRISPPKIRFRGLPAFGCVPFYFTPNYSVNLLDTITSFFWTFGDGATSQDSTPFHIYSVPGFYDVSLIIQTTGGCSDTLTVTRGVRVSENTATAFDFAIDTPIVCVNQNVSFTPLVTGQNLVYAWYFGDQTSSNDQDAEHSYTDTGSYSVRLDVRFESCVSSVLKTNAVRVIGPVADYSFVIDCTEPRKVFFTNLSRNFVSVLWDFGDGTTSADVNPVHTYSADGNYTVLLTTYNNCSDTSSQIVPVSINSLAISASSYDVCTGDSIFVTLTHPQAEYVQSYNFNFTGSSGDRFLTSTNDTVKWAFRSGGTYGITAYIIDKSGCSDTVTLSTAINVHGPVAKFSVVNGLQCAGKVTDFTDASATGGSYAITEWSWDFGDGTIQNYTSPPFNHIYTLPGRYTVSLKVTDQFGCTDSVTQPDIITSYKAIADFGSIDSSGCPGRPVRFTDRSTGAIFRRSWDFGDGSTSSDVNPRHVYKAVGVYTVKLIVFSAGGCIDSITKVNFISLDYPKAAFSLSDSIATCPPLQVSFFDSSKYVTNYTWSLGDGSISSVQNPAANYFLPGNYQVKLTVTSPGGCKDSAYATILIAGPNGTISYSPTFGCSPVNVNSNVKTTGAVYFTWDFGDGFTTEGADSSTSHIYASGGKFLPKVLIRNPDGCSVPVVGGDTILIEKLRPAFVSDVSFVCDTGSVYFTDSSISTGNLSHKWSFGDGTGSTLQNPSHRYTTPGKYAVSLVIASSLGCADSITYTNFITVFKSPQPTIIVPAEICAGQVSFTSSVVADSAAPVTSYAWKFGNNDSAKVTNPPSQTFSAGTYVNYLTVTTTNGCSATVSKDLLVNPVPVLLLSNDTTICLNDTILLSVSGAVDYTWTDPLNTLSCSNCDNPYIYPIQQTTYLVTGTSSAKCTTQDSVKVNVLTPFTIQAPEAYDICRDRSVQISASGAFMYTWSPSAGLSSTNIPAPLVTPANTTQYTVTGYDSLGCFTDTANVIVNVNSYPTIDLINDITSSVGNKIILTPVVSNDVVKYTWTPSSYLSCTNCSAPEATATSNITYRLVVTSDKGCSIEDTLRITVTCGNSALFVPNTFSPNNDGANDIFYIRAKGISAVQSFRIINRIGEPVFDKRNITPNNISAGWDGTYKGQKAETGVYIYYMEVVCTNNEILKYSGNVTLIR